MRCEYCDREFDPIATRWLCPHCHMKHNCCDGAPLPADTAPRRAADLVGAKPERAS
jgi:hypothetical protein